MKKLNLNTQFAQQVIAAAQLGCQTLSPGDVREASQLCGKEFWGGLSKKQQPQAGLVISQAVDDGLLPLTKKGSSQRNHHLYEQT